MRRGRVPGPFLPRAGLTRRPRRGAAVAAGNPVVPLVKEILALVPEEARPWVHHGATSQDVIDSGHAQIYGIAWNLLLARSARLARADAPVARAASIFSIVVCASSAASAAASCRCSAASRCA